MFGVLGRMGTELDASDSDEGDTGDTSNARSSAGPSQKQANVDPGAIEIVSLAPNLAICSDFVYSCSRF